MKANIPLQLWSTAQYLIVHREAQKHRIKTSRDGAVDSSWRHHTADLISTAMPECQRHREADPETASRRSKPIPRNVACISTTVSPGPQSINVRKLAVHTILIRGCDNTVTK